MHKQTLTNFSLLVLVAGLTLSCKKESTPPAAEPSSNPQVPMVVIVPATQPVQVNRENAVFYVSTEGYPNQPIIFPPAKMIVSEDADQLHISIQSDDPPEASKEGYTGNSFRFDFSLALDQALSGATYDWKSRQTEEPSDAYGLTLQGGRQMARPEEMIISIEGDNDLYTVTLTGRFQLVGENPNETPPQPAMIKSILKPEVIHEKD